MKNTDWNKKEFLLSCRKAWTNIINSTLERKRLDDRIDHRTLKAQGLDHESMTHMEHVATVLKLDNKAIEDLTQKLANIETVIENLVKLEFEDSICSEGLYKIVIEGGEKMSFYLKASETTNPPFSPYHYRHNNSNDCS